MHAVLATQTSLTSQRLGCTQFRKSVDGYHEAIARCMGANFLLVCYALYSGWLGANVRRHSLVTSQPCTTLL